MRSQVAADDTLLTANNAIVMTANRTVSTWATAGTSNKEHPLARKVCAKKDSQADLNDVGLFSLGKIGK